MGTIAAQEGSTSARSIVEGRQGRVAPARRITPVNADLLAVVAIVVVGTIVAWLRLPATTSDTLWAEDSRNFIGNAVAQGPVAPLFRVYAGYLHTVPRIIAGVTVTTVPVVQWAHAMALGSCVVVAVVAAAVFFCARVVSESWWVRLALAAITILVPLAPREVLGNTANLHWYFLWLAPWLILYRSRSTRGTVALTVIAALGALTEVQMLAFVPLLALRWKTGARLPVRVALLGGGTLQVIAYLSSPRGHTPNAPNDTSSTVLGYLINSAMTMWNANEHVIGRALVHFGPAAGVAALVPVAVAAVWALRLGTRDQRWLVVTFLAASVVLWVVAVKMSPGPYYEYSAFPSSRLADPWLSRYGVVPSMELLAVIVIALGIRFRPLGAAEPTSQQSRRVPFGRIAVGAVVLSLVLVSFVPASTRRSVGPEYTPQVMAAERACVGRPSSTPVVLVSPPKAAWKIYLDCGRLPQVAAAKTPVRAG